MKKNYYIKKTEKLLENYAEMKITLEYYTELVEADALPIRKAEVVRAKISHMSSATSAIERALDALTSTERDIITGLYFIKEQTFFDVCDACALERSSVYRYRASAIKKIARFLYSVRI